MSAIFEDKTDKMQLATQVKAYVSGRHEEPVYVRNLMDKFGNTPDEKDSIRSLVWAMISRRDLKLEDDLTLTSGR